MGLRHRAIFRPNANHLPHQTLRVNQPAGRPAEVVRFCKHLGGTSMPWNTQLALPPSLACCCHPCPTQTQELLRVNLLKGAREVVRSSKLIGRASVPLANSAAQPFIRK